MNLNLTTFTDCHSRNPIILLLHCKFNKNNINPENTLRNACSNSSLSIRRQRIAFLQKGAKTFRGTVVIFMLQRLPDPHASKAWTHGHPPPRLKVTVKDEVSMRHFYAWLDELPTILSINLSRTTITIHNRILKYRQRINLSGPHQYRSSLG